jgi:hypothetical protein
LQRGFGTLSSALDWGSHQVLWPWFMEASHSTFFLSRLESG